MIDENEPYAFVVSDEATYYKRKIDAIASDIKSVRMEMACFRDEIARIRKSMDESNGKSEEQSYRLECLWSSSMRQK